jgi:hypothetical protein
MILERLHRNLARLRNALYVSVLAARIFFSCNGCG